MPTTQEIIEGHIKGLDYRSETNSAVTMFVPTARRRDPVDYTQMEQLTGRKRANHPQYSDFDAWFQHQVNVQDQHEQWADLYKSMTEILSPRYVFWMINLNERNFQIYVVGIDLLNNLIGIQMNAVET